MRQEESRKSKTVVACQSLVAIEISRQMGIRCYIKKIARGVFFCLIE